MPDPSLHDEQLEREIQLVGELVLAASQSEHHLTEERIDEILGVHGDPEAPVSPHGRDVSPDGRDVGPGP